MADVIVSSHFEEDVSWLDDLGLPYLVVSKGRRRPNVRNFCTIPNRGLEFGSYVWYILASWDHLPESVHFIHGHLDSYHQQMPMDESIRVFSGPEFASLNGEFSLAIHRLRGEHPWFGSYFHEMWRFLGLDFVHSCPDVCAITPCTQSSVSRELIKSLGKPFWERVFHSLMSHEAHCHLALVLEIAWPTIFGSDSRSVDEFRFLFDDRGLSILIAHPKEAWNSSMLNTVKFQVPGSRDSWVSCCMEIFQESAKVY